jgi:ABC-type multidrug transport system fused ATPase/permease subunit
MLPSINRIYTNYNEVMFWASSLRYIYDDLNNISYEVEEKEITFKNEIKFKNVSFGYKKEIFKNLNLSIKKGDKIAIVGKSGLGKTTFIDLLIGIIKPTKGEILIDGVKLDEKNIKSWQSKIGYVPQHIYFANEKVVDIITCCEEVNLKRVKEVLEFVGLLDFFNKYNGIETKIESEVNLSGGERQRLAIARALYKNPEILILDEATTGMDKKLEDMILKKILSLNKTILIITHKDIQLPKINLEAYCEN